MNWKCGYFRNFLLESKKNITMIARGVGLGMRKRSSVNIPALKPAVSFIGQPPLTIGIESPQVEVSPGPKQTMAKGGDGPRSPTTEALVNSLEMNIKKRARMKAARSLDRATFWSICRASIFGGLLFGLGFTMSILGFYKEFFATVKAKPLKANVKIEPHLDHSVLSQFEILSYAGPCVMAVGAFVLMLSCVAVLEHRDRRHTLRKTLKQPKNIVANNVEDSNKPSTIKELDFKPTPKLSVHTVKPKISITSDVGIENVTFLSDSNNEEMNNNVEKLAEENEPESLSTVDQDPTDPAILNNFLNDVERRTCGSFLKHANSDNLLGSANVHYLSPERYEMSEMSQPMIRRRVSLTKSDPEKLLHSHENGVLLREQEDEYCAEDNCRKESFVSLEPIVIIKNQIIT